MNLVTPDTGLLFWMVVIFGLVFFLLWKFGFPIITEMVDKRNSTIEKSLKDAHEIESRLAGMMAEHAQMLEDARKEQTDILKDAADTRNKMIADAKQQAREEADKILAEARTEIAAEKEAALRDVRREVALLSVSIAEKILRKDLSDDKEQREFIDKMVDETVQSELHS
ncbi:MAG: F0F1 ATP synthase subunit B [Bacteroidales bacterium]|jgi:F-type H+-transporting ATPase subunit b|nr:F0F1 ATP synthase subunit B [Bacteroidales bacterium]